MKIKVMRTVIRMIGSGIPSDRIFISWHVNMMVASGEYLAGSAGAEVSPKNIANFTNYTNYTNYTTDMPGAHMTRKTRKINTSLSSYNNNEERIKLLSETREILDYFYANTSNSRISPWFFASGMILSSLIICILLYQK
ncbi:hypothetical protein AAL09_18675 [Salmonella enterica subsp. enterica serovar Newport]|nr:hypothetical protein [Salmonella enterica subsp. enterica serovar Newport]